LEINALNKKALNFYPVLGLKDITNELKSSDMGLKREEIQRKTDLS